MFDQDGKTLLGLVTSGGPSPCLGKSIAMGYVKEGYHKQGTRLLANIRGTMRELSVSKLPFVENRYHRPPK